jgi:hypothetical protein
LVSTTEPLEVNRLSEVLQGGRQAAGDRQEGHGGARLVRALDGGHAAAGQAQALGRIIDIGRQVDRHQSELVP